MIYTVTFNPALDYSMITEDFCEGITNRSEQEEICFGGKGINVSYVLSELGVENTALGFVAGFTGDYLVSELKKNKVNTDFIKLDNGITRINVKLKGNVETEINAQGPQITDDAVELLYKKLDNIKSGDTLILAGSIPKSLNKNILRICDYHVSDNQQSYLACIHRQSSSYPASCNIPNTAQGADDEPDSVHRPRI